MCRFLAWIGAPRFLDDFVVKADQSLVTLSRSALVGKTSLNADGFGLAWYSERDTPCIYKDVYPAWPDANLMQIASHTKARVFLAHVRASTSTATSRNNCHPFSRGRWSFMHNGQLGGHLKLRQKLDGMIPLECYDQRYGATDSEAIFLVAAGLGLDQAPIVAMERNHPSSPAALARVRYVKSPTLMRLVQSGMLGVAGVSFSGVIYAPISQPGFPRLC
ncbi:class II glutamine amidotransferase [Rhizobium laguerreae]|nr:class II glutamine amidotransferase [Rhizobium laguerreae]